MFYSAIFSLLLVGLSNVDLQNMLQKAQSDTVELNSSSVGDDAQLADVG